jgi:hypothetical protein
MAEQTSTPKLLKKIVLGYELPALPTFLMRSFMLLRSKLGRAGFQIEVVLRPLNQLPPDTDLLFVPTGLVEAARQAAPPTAWVVPLTASTAQQPAYDELLKQLEAGQVIYALRVEAGEHQSGSRPGTIVRYRGYTRLA